MKNAKTINLKVDSDSVRVNCGIVKVTGANVVALEVDLYQRAKITACGHDKAPFIAIEPIDNDDAPSWTKISFQDYIGWIVWCAEVSKTTLAVCLIKEKQ